MKPARFGVTINPTQQKVIAAYLAVFALMILWRIDQHLQQIAAQQHRRQMREARRRDREPFGPVGAPDRAGDQDGLAEANQEAIDNAIEELEADENGGERDV